jgi:cysteine desulfurase / selenocysteine lyase
VKPIDVETARRDTPGCGDRVHLNNAGASLMPTPVVDTVVSHLELEGRLGGYESADAEHDRIESVYASAADLLNCEPGEIALLENATRAWDAVFYSIPFEPGDRILTSRAEYCSNFMAYLQVSRRTGAEVLVIDDDEHGQIDIARLAEAVDDRVKLISISHIPTSSGLVNPALAVGRIANDAGIPFLLDACQSVGQMPLDVQAIGCDFLSATGRKFLRGPRGTGFLYVSKTRAEQLEPAFVEVGGSNWTSRDGYTLKQGARRFETWEVSYALQLGLGRAIDYALGLGLDRIWERVAWLGAELRAQLSSLPGVTIHDRGAVLCGIVTFTVDGTSADEIRRSLARGRINVYVSTIQDTRLDFEDRGLDQVVRASVHYFNTEDELAKLRDGVEALTAAKS